MHDPGIGVAPGLGRIGIARDELAQGTLQVMWQLQEMLCEVSGMDGCSLQPSAGAQGELTGLMMMRAWHASQGRSPKKVLPLAGSCSMKKR